jgi:hypothetical protein
MALAIRTHLPAATVWCTGRATRLGGCLRRLADQQLVLVSTGASHWLDSRGTAEPVHGGCHVTALKILAAARRPDDLVMTIRGFTRRAHKHACAGANHKDQGNALSLNASLA